MDRDDQPYHTSDSDALVLTHTSCNITNTGLTVILCYRLCLLSSYLICLSCSFNFGVCASFWVQLCGVGFTDNQQQWCVLYGSCPTLIGHKLWQTFVFRSCRQYMTFLKTQDQTWMLHQTLFVQEFS